MVGLLEEIQALSAANETLIQQKLELDTEAAMAEEKYQNATTSDDVLKSAIRVQRARITELQTQQAAAENGGVVIETRFRLSASFLRWVAASKELRHEAHTVRHRSTLVR